MKGFLASVGFTGLLAVTGCSTPVVGYHSAECDFMLPTERDRCVRINESNKKAVAERYSRDQAIREQGRADYPREKQPVREQPAATSPRISTEEP